MIFNYKNQKFYKLLVSTQNISTSFKNAVPRPSLYQIYSAASSKCVSYQLSHIFQNVFLEKAEELEVKLPTSVGSYKKQQNSRRTSTSASLTVLKPLTMWITTNCGKFFKRWEYQTTLPASWETCMQVKKQQNQTWNKDLFHIGKKEYVKAV